MKKIYLFLACLCATGLSSCAQYSNTELGLSNYLDYFEISEGKSDVLFDSEKGTWEAPKDVGAASAKTHFNALFTVKSDKLENMYYEDVKFTYSINLYYGKTTISDADVPDHSLNFTSQLHYYTEFDDGTKEKYVVGFGLWTATMDYYAANDKYKTYVISYLATDYYSTSYEGSNYYRQIKLTAVSGTVSEGGLSDANADNCN